MQTEQKHGMTVKNTAGIAFTAYVGVKVVQALSSMTVNVIHFRRARKADKPVEA